MRSTRLVKAAAILAVLLGGAILPLTTVSPAVASGNVITLTGPGNQTSQTGVQVAAVVYASDSDPAQTLTFTATGLPPGISIFANSGTMEGTITAAGTYPVTVTATDGTGATASVTFTWAAYNRIVVSVPGTSVNQATQVNGTADLQMVWSDSSPVATVTFTATGLPPGLSISPGGLISGTATTTGSYSVTVTATDDSGAQASTSLVWGIYGTLTVPQLPNQVVGLGSLENLTIPAIDSVPGTTISCGGNPLGAPPDLLFVPSSCTFSGVVTEVGSYSAQVVVHDNLFATATTTITWTVKPEPGLWPAGLIRSGISARCLGDANGSTAAQNPIVLGPCTGAGTQWSVGDNGTLDFGGKCATASGTQNGAKVWLATCAGLKSQQWLPSSGATMKNPATGKCLADPGSTSTAGTRLELLTCSSTQHGQRWTPPVYRLHESYGQPTAFCAASASPTPSNGTAAVTATCGTSSAQKFSVGPAGEIRVLGKCLAVAGSATANGTKADLSSCTGSAAQIWWLEPNGYLANPNSGRCLTAPSSTPAAGVKLVIWDCTTQLGSTVPGMQVWAVQP